MSGQPEEPWAAQDDAALMAAIANGNRRAFATLAERHGLRFRALSFRLLRDTMAAEDVVQDCFIKLWQRPDSYDPARAKFTSWFHRIVVNRSLDMLRKTRPDQLADSYDKESDDIGAEERMAADQTMADIRSAILTLPEKQQTAITMCYLDDMSNKETAEALDMNLKALESLLHRARKQLKETLLKTGLTGADPLPLTADAGRLTKAGS